MIGRGTLGSPWLVGQIDCAIKGKAIPETPGPKEKIKLACEQLQSLVKEKGDHGLLIARKHLSWTCTGFEDSEKLRTSLMKATTPSEAISLLEKQLILL